MLIKYKGTLHFRDYKTAFSAFKSLVYENEKTIFYVPCEHRANPTYFAVSFINDTTLIVDFDGNCPPNFYDENRFAVLKFYSLAASGELIFSKFEDNKWIEINLKPGFILLENVFGG